MSRPILQSFEEKGQAGGRNHSSRPTSTASLSTGKGTSCGPLLCLCYTRVAMHGRSFPSARVIVLNVFPSVEPTTVVHVCIQFAGFEQTVSKKYIASLCILRIFMLLLFSATLGGGSTGVIREPRHRPLLLVSYRTARIRELPPQPTGRGTNTRSLWRPRPPMVANH